ncbi:hypothetical protein UFOVP685_4 [uncultured Caudovirales phage]|uniref:Uncharacterized protein n=1 Tax=uncultured Caudovirales phage TaxID=2100421 RepID=A0A6J5N2G5_9CAUD|nr:hypothetical protein UFOVP590_19 [uncultured Caudovirales phage]CAB4157121.1 hypothetical protein UFOVP685_4 [uncultured Caudovirales phage]CAB5225569.1 hypothetical protein UFOVP750_48 [uncultured Caudovirales phage]
MSITVESLEKQLDAYTKQCNLYQEALHQCTGIINFIKIQIQELVSAESIMQDEPKPQGEDSLVGENVECNGDEFIEN